MKTVRVDTLEQPYIENSTLYMPVDYQIQNGDAARWIILTEEPVMSIVQMKWKDTYKPGQAAGWVFFVNRQEVGWNDAPNKTAIVREFRRRCQIPMINDVIPWGDDIETLVALESL